MSVVFEPTYRSSEIPSFINTHVITPFSPTDPKKLRNSDWIIENSRTARWGAYEGAPVQMVVDPTVILGTSCFSEFRPGIEKALGRAQLCAPEAILADTLALCIRLERSEKLSCKDVRRVLHFVHCLPLRLVRTDYDYVHSELMPLGIPSRAAFYLDAARTKPSVVMSFDNTLIKWSRKLRIPRCRFIRDHRLGTRA